MTFKKTRFNTIKVSGATCTREKICECGTCTCARCGVLSTEIGHSMRRYGVRGCCLCEIRRKGARIVSDQVNVTVEFGNALSDQRDLRKLLENPIDFIFHCAAYEHIGCQHTRAYLHSVKASFSHVQLSMSTALHTKRF